MRYLSVCSGIEAATQAWAPLGWTPVAFSEIEPFPCAVLAHHYPGVPNWGDMTRYQEWPDADVDVLCGGTPCQSFSVAGLRKGLADPRGSLMLTFGAIAARYRPRWLVWENVPGVLSSGGGRDFGAFLGMLGELGYGWSYRVLDAQHVRTRRFPRAVPQRRRRVFVVGHLGDWRRAAAVLFDRESLSGHPAPRRSTGEDPAGNPALGFGGGRQSGPSDVATAHGHRLDWEVETFVAEPVAHALRAQAQLSHQADRDVLIAFRASEEGEVTFDRSGPPGASSPQAQAVAFDLRGREGGAMPEGPHDTANLRAASGGSSRSYVAFGISSDAIDRSGEGDGTPGQRAGLGVVEGCSPTIRARPNNAVATPWAVRRLTPRECERLQGFPDNFTLIPCGKKPSPEIKEELARYFERTGQYMREEGPGQWVFDRTRFEQEWPRLAADGPRYKALGNSWAVNCAEWIGERIAEVDAWTEAA